MSAAYAGSTEMATTSSLATPAGPAGWHEIAASGAAGCGVLSLVMWPRGARAQRSARQRIHEHERHTAVGCGMQTIARMQQKA